jgi:hypothetical protein
MRLMTIIRPFAISVVLLTVTPAFAARAIHPDTHDICREQNVGFCRPLPFDEKFPARSAMGKPGRTRPAKPGPAT